jgi:hypothetical protein
MYSYFREAYHACAVCSQRLREEDVAAAALAPADALAALV